MLTSGHRTASLQLIEMLIDRSTAWSGAACVHRSRQVIASLPPPANSGTYAETGSSMSKTPCSHARATATELAIFEAENHGTSSVGASG
jgi:hypothetical protein